MEKIYMVLTNGTKVSGTTKLYPTLAKAIEEQVLLSATKESRGRASGRLTRPLVISEKMWDSPIRRTK